MKKVNVKQLFNGDWEFLLGADNIKQVPDTKYPEIAFIGASNVGKSSLINALTGRKIAITSKTPGRTQQLNFFLLDNKLVFVDMPGFGYAKAGKQKIENWQKTAVQYLSTRKNIKRTFLLIDPIKGIKDHDRDIANIFNTLAISFQIILTKTDKMKSEQLDKIKANIVEETKKWPALHPEIIYSSSLYKTNVEYIQNMLAEILENCS